jgi:hypothetical protein
MKTPINAENDTFSPLGPLHVYGSTGKTFQGIGRRTEMNGLLLKVTGRFSVNGISTLDPSSSTSPICPAEGQYDASNGHVMVVCSAIQLCPTLSACWPILRLIWRLAMESALLANTFHTMYQSKSNQLSGPNAIYALFSTLLVMLEDCPGAFILIDALDECSSGTEREQLLDLIAKHAKSSKTKWLLSSRNDADIKRVLMHEGRRSTRGASFPVCRSSC